MSLSAGKTASDVFKHSVLLRCSQFLNSTSSKWTYVDYFPGEATESVSDFPQAQLQQILDRPINVSDDILGEYATFIHNCQEGDDVTVYPGRVEFVASNMFDHDRAFMVSENKTHVDYLNEVITDPRFKIKHVPDISKSVTSLIPRTRRGLAYYDTATFAEPASDETQIKVGDIAGTTANLWPSSTTVVAYPLDGKQSRPFMLVDRLLQGGSNRVLTAELYENARRSKPQGYGIVISNPPYEMERHLNHCLDQLTSIFFPAPGEQKTTARYLVRWLTPHDTNSHEYAQEGDAPLMYWDSPEWQRPMPKEEMVFKMLAPETAEERRRIIHKADGLDAFEDWVPSGADWQYYRRQPAGDYPPASAMDDITGWDDKVKKIAGRNAKDTERMYAWIRQNRKYKD